MRSSEEKIGRVRRIADRVHGQRRRVATAAAAVLAIAVGYHVVFGRNGLTAYEAKRADARELARQAQVLMRENEDLRGHVERLTTDPGAIEHQAREELHYTRPGEVIVPLGPDAPAPAAVTPSGTRR